MDKNDEQKFQMDWTWEEEDADADAGANTAESDEKCDEKKDEKKGAKKEICVHEAMGNLLEDHHEGTVVCSKCGIVVVEQMISGVSEFRAFGDDTQADIWQRLRIGDVANRFLSSGANLSTSIRPAEGGYSGRSSGQSSGANSFNASIYQSIKRKSVDNGIYTGLRRLDEMADRIHLPQSVLEYAQFLYYKMYKRGKFKGIALATDAKVGACLYIACYHAQCPRTVNEICGISEHGHESIRRAVKKITKLLNLPVGAIVCRDVMPRYTRWLDLPHEIERKASTIADELSKHDKRTDFQVETLSGAAIYFVVQQKGVPEKYKRTQKEIADSLGIDTDDLQQCYQLYCQIFCPTDAEN